MNLAEHLAASGLAGRVATAAGACVENARRLVAGDPDCTFGLSDWRDADFDEVIEALRRCGVTLDDPDSGAHVDPAVAALAIERQRDILAGWARQGARILVATGHPFAFLTHYAGLAKALAAAGCQILEPLGGERGRPGVGLGTPRSGGGRGWSPARGAEAAGEHRLKTPDGEPCSVRYFEGVGSLIVHGSLCHTHRSDYMEAMLDAAGGAEGVDAVIADHGYAGAAIEAGIPTVSIADVNDPALPLAQARGRADGVVVIDDGLTAAAYEPVTAFMISGFAP